MKTLISHCDEEDWRGPGQSVVLLSMDISTSHEKSQMTVDVMGKQIQVLIDTKMAYSVLASFSRKPSSRSVVIIGVEGALVGVSSDLLLHVS